MNNTERLIELIDSDSDEAVFVQEMDFDIPKEEKNIETSIDIDKEDDEDVPSDFFDDFLNNEFMDGLDVVDAWDDENERKEGKLSKQKRSTSKTKSSRVERSRRRRSRSRSLLRQRYREEYYRRRPRSREQRNSRDRRSNERNKDAARKSVKSETRVKSKEPGDGDDIDHRRDPEKTKRDIQKDKDKCAKTQEDKFISEKLKVVETGLVPPGTELDFDLTTLKSSSEVKQKKGTKPANVRNPKRKSISPKTSGRKKISPSKTRIKRGRYSRSPVRRRSRSPIRFSRSPIRKPRRSSERRYISDRSARFADYSPKRYRRLSRELSFEMSPEPRSPEPKWRSQDRRYFKGLSRNRSSSRSRGLDFLEELANKLSEKKKYYKKVQQIMTQTTKRSTNYHPMPTMPPPTPVPAPMPIPHIPPAPYFPQVDTTPQYDHHFFIGQQFPPHPIHYPPPPFIDPPPNNIVATPNVLETSIIQPPQMQAIIACSTPVNNVVPSGLNPSNNISVEIQKEKEAINKLFEDKKISLSDFLSMSAKHSNPSEPINVQKKIKVISLCQDAVKALGGDLQLYGRFFLKKTRREAEKPQEGKYCSPLRKIPVVRFSFTTPSKHGDEKMTMRSTLSKLTASLGIVDSVPVEPVKPALNSPLPEPVFKMDTPNVYTQRPAASRSDSVSQISAKKAKMCQTDPIKCQVCEVRKSRTFVDAEIQHKPTYVSVGTQMTDDDLLRMGVKLPVKDNLKNQSLAHLTPAQLMRQTLGQDDHLQSSPYVPVRSQPEISPEKQNYRPNLKGNDHFNRPNLSGNDNYARSLFGFDKRPEFGNFGNSNRLPPTQFDNRSDISSRGRSFEGQDRMFIENRNSNFNTPNSDMNMGGNSHFESGRNFANNPNPLIMRNLLPNQPAVGRKY